eukprot:30769-Pelagococcus_subviridis.AAC.6
MRHRSTREGGRAGRKRASYGEQSHLGPASATYASSSANRPSASPNGRRCAPSRPSGQVAWCVNAAAAYAAVSDNGLSHVARPTISFPREARPTRFGAWRGAKYSPNRALITSPAAYPSGVATSRASHARVSASKNGSSDDDAPPPIWFTTPTRRARRRRRHRAGALASTRTREAYARSDDAARKSSHRRRHRDVERPETIAEEGRRKEDMDGGGGGTERVSVSVREA